MKKTHQIGAIFGCLLSLSHPSRAAETAQITVTATVVASCSVTTDKTTVDLGNIDASEFASAGAGELLTKYAGSFTLGASCFGSQYYDYDIAVTGKIIGKCVQGNNSSSIAFCVTHDSKPIDFGADGKATLRRPTSSTSTTLTVTPKKPNDQVPWYGTNTFSMTIIISPV